MTLRFPRSAAVALALSIIGAATLSQGASAQAPLAGRLTAPVISGLSYVTERGTGTTGADGGFTYRPGEIVRFMLGDIELGRATGRPELGLADLAGGDAGATLLIARLLLSLDMDEDAGNGVAIDPETAARFAHSGATLSDLAHLAGLLERFAPGHGPVSVGYVQAVLNPPAASRFTRLDADGRPSVADTGLCITDATTGLTWENKTADGLRAASHTYLAAPIKGGDQGICAPELAACTAQDYVKHVNETGLCGAKDWRVPSARELKSLLEPARLATGPAHAAIDPQHFPHTVPGPYLTDQVQRVFGIVAVWFDDTHRTLPDTALSRQRAMHLRLVRGPRLSEPAKPERLAPFIPLDRHGRPTQDSTWTCVDEAMRPDRLQTITLWYAPSGADTADPDAQVAALEATATCGVRGWRLPNADELARLRLAARSAGGHVPEFRHFVPDADYWTNEGEQRVITSGDGTTRRAQADQRAGFIAIATLPRPPMVERRAPHGKRPDANELAALRDQYARYVPGQARQPHWPAPDIDASVSEGFQDIGLLPPPPFPHDNPYSEAKVVLGETLFFDRRLSRNDQIACAACHDPETGWTDKRPTSTGHIGQLGERNAMSILNTAYATSLFWDGRAATLEEQAKGPVVNPAEMHQPLGRAVDKIAAAPEYAPLFTAAFGDADVDLDRIAKAIATFERTLVSHDSAFDRFLKGERDALDDKALWGLHLFRTKARCINCHNSPLFSDNHFHSNGLHYYDRELEDRGRYNVTGDPADIGRFRTPPLRDIIHTGAYMHNGLFPLTENVGVLAMYDAGMVQTPAQGRSKYDRHYPRTAPEIRPLGLSPDEKRALFAFLHAISGPPRMKPASREELGLAPAGSPVD